MASLPKRKIPGELIANSPYCFEVVRLSLLGLPTEEIASILKEKFRFKVSLGELEAFLRLYGQEYEEAASSSLQLSLQLAEKGVELFESTVPREADRIVAMLSEVDQHIERVEERARSSKMPSMEQALIGFYRLKKDLLARLTELQKESGLGAVVRKAIERTARLAVQTFIKAVPAKERERLFQEFAEGVDQLAIEFGVVSNEERK